MLGGLWKAVPHGLCWWRRLPTGPSPQPSPHGSPCRARCRRCSAIWFVYTRTISRYRRGSQYRLARQVVRAGQIDSLSPRERNSVLSSATGCASSLNWLPLPVGEGWGEGPARHGASKIAQQKRDESSSAARALFISPVGRGKDLCTAIDTPRFLWPGWRRRSSRSRRRDCSSTLAHSLDRLVRGAEVARLRRNLHANIEEDPRHVRPDQTSHAGYRAFP